MRRFLPLAACLLVMSCTAPASGEAAIVPSLIPQPAAMRAGAGSFTIDADTTVLANSDIAQRVAAHFNRLLTAANRPALEYSQDDIAGIHFDLRPEASLPPEGYRLTVQPGTEGIFVTASDEAGLFYGAVTLWQLLTQGEDGRVVLPAMH
ncbi:glycoside hydrolase family 20 zincin-like fold domain-containing protein, partial [Pseudoxanthomonas sangjuensis]